MREAAFTDCLAGDALLILEKGGRQGEKNVESWPTKREMLQKSHKREKEKTIILVYTQNRQ